MSKENLNLYFSKKNPATIIPTKQDEDAGYDIYAANREEIILIKPSAIIEFDCGLGIACPPEYFPIILDKGSYGSIGVTTTAGVGDSGYRDSYFITLANLNQDKYVVITNQNENEIEKADAFNPVTKKFENSNGKPIFSAYKYRHVELFDGISFEMGNILIKKEDVLVKRLEKAIVQIVLLYLNPQLSVKELPWEEFQAIPSIRGTGKKGSSGK